MGAKKQARAQAKKHGGARWSAVLPARIRDLQAEHELTQEAFGARCGVGKSTVHNWLTGRNLIRLDELRAVCDAFGVTSDWLLGVDHAPKYRQAWPATESTFSEMLAAEMLRDLPPVLVEMAGGLAVSVERVLEDARARVHQEARELAAVMDGDDRELGEAFKGVTESLLLLREWASESRGKYAERSAREALNAAIAVSEIRQRVYEARRPRVFSSSGTNEMRYLRLTPEERRVWSERDGSPRSVKRAWSPRLRRWMSEQPDIHPIKGT